MNKTVRNLIIMGLFTVGGGWLGIGSMYFLARATISAGVTSPVTTMMQLFGA